MMTMRIRLYKPLAAATPPFALGIILVFAPALRCEAQTQTQAQPAAQTAVAALHEAPPSGAEHDGGKTANPVPGALAAPDPEISPAVAKQLAAMQVEIEQLKAALSARISAPPQPL